LAIRARRHRVSDADLPFSRIDSFLDRIHVVDFQLLKPGHTSAVGPLPSLPETDARPQPQPGVVAVWSLIGRRYRAILVGLLAGVSLAGLYTVFATPVFESSTRILVTARDPFLSTQGSQSPQELIPPVSEDLLATHMQILVSPRVIGSALASQGLDQLPSLVGALDESQTATEYVVDHLRITRGGEGQGRAAHVINVGFRHTQDVECARLLKALIASYDDFLEQTFRGGIGEAARLIERAENNIGRELGEISAEYTQLRQSSSLLHKGTEILNVHLLHIERYEARLAEIRLKKAETESRLRLVPDARGGDDMAAGFDLGKLSLIGPADVERLSLLLGVRQDGPNTQQFRASQSQRTKTVSTEHDLLLTLKLRDEELGTRLGPGHPQIKGIRSSIEQVTRFLEQKQRTLTQLQESSKLKPIMVVRAYREMLEHDLADLNRQESEIQTLVDGQRQAADSMVKDEVHEEELTDRRDRTRQAYDAVVKQLKDVNLAKDYGGFVTEVIAPVEIGEKVSPRPVLLLSLGALLGLGVAAGVALVIDHADHTFRGDEDIRWTLGLPVLDHVSAAVSRNGKNGSAPASPMDPTLVAYHRPASQEAEAYGRLRTLLTHADRDEPANVLQVTSPTPGDGKTTLTANLAIALARGGKKVLLVDADVRRPRLAHLFGLQRNVDLCSLLAGAADLGDVAESTSVPGLCVVGCGPSSGQLSDLLTRPSLDRFLDQARRQFDVVLFDSPALLTASDSLEIASRADRVLLIIHAQNSNGESAIRARDLLSSVGARVWGVVVNDTSGHGRETIGQRLRAGFSLPGEALASLGVTSTVRAGPRRTT
jgi:succinoglycan biosynthesis transport protein ExoP